MSDVPDRLSADDARILALESNTLTGHTLKLIVLAPGAPLDLEALREAVSARLPTQPRATQRVETESGPPRWVEAEGFDIGEHVRRRDAGCSTWEELRLVVSALMSEHLDRSRPLWTLDLIGPLADGREVIAARLHHAMVDGIAGVRFLESVLLDPHDAPVHAAGVRTPPAAASLSARDEWRRMPAALGRELGRPGSRSPFDRPVTSARELAFTALPLAGLTEIGASRPAHTTVNDVLLATVAGGLRSWLGRPGPGRMPWDLRAQIPVSLHHRDEATTALGNRDSFINVDLELAESDPVRRLDRISAQTRTEKQLDDAQLLYDLFHALGRFGPAGELVQRLADDPREFSVAISNVPGPRVTVSVARRPVTRLFSSAEPGSHHALRISAISDADTLGIGFCTDPTALPGIAGLADAVAEAYSALHHATVGEPA